MLQYIVTITIALSILTSTAVALEDIADSSAQTALVATERMHNAMDCAFAGIPIEVCEPDIYGANIDLESTQQQITNIIEQDIAP